MTCLRKATFLFATVYLAATAAASDIRSRIAQCDTVIIGRVNGFSPGVLADSWSAYGKRDELGKFVTTNVTMEVLDTLVGDAPRAAIITFPRRLPSTDPRVGFTFVRGSVGIFFLRHRNKSGVFENGYCGLASVWDAPGATLAPMEFNGISYVPLLTAEHNDNLPFLVRMADLFARNAAVTREARMRSFYLRLLADITPDQADAFGIGNVQCTPGENLKAAADWLHNDLPQILPANGPADQLNLDAIRVDWGDRQFLARFLNEYLALPTGILLAPRPLVDTADQVIRLLPRMHGDDLRAAILGLGSPINRKERVKCLAAVIQFAGKDSVYVDMAIVEAASHMFDLGPGFSRQSTAGARPVEALAALKKLSRSLSASESLGQIKR